MNSKETTNRAFKHPHDRALIAFGSDVLALLETGALFHVDTLNALKTSASNFGLATVDTNGLVATRRDCFENPLNM